MGIPNYVPSNAIKDLYNNWEVEAMKIEFREGKENSVKVMKIHIDGIPFTEKEFLGLVHFVGDVMEIKNHEWPIKGPELKRKVMDSFGK